MMKYRHVERVVRSYDREVTRGIPRGVPFVSVDPGITGAGVVFEPTPSDGVRPVRVFPFVAAERSHAELAQYCVHRGVSVVVMEDQFLGRNAASMIDLVRSAQSVVAMMQLLWMQEEKKEGPVQLHNERLQGQRFVVWVQPSVWCHGLFRMTQSAKREERKARAMQHAESDSFVRAQLMRVHAKYREGVADAYSIGCYWEEVGA